MSELFPEDLRQGDEDRIWDMNHEGWGQYLREEKVRKSTAGSQNKYHLGHLPFTPAPRLPSRGARTQIQAQMVSWGRAGVLMHDTEK